MNETAFVRVLGRSPIIRLLDFLILERGLFDYSISEISENTGVSWITVGKLLKSLARNGIVKKTRRVAKAEMYVLDEENPVVQVLIGIYNMLSRIMAGSGKIMVETLSSEKAMAVVLNGKDGREAIKALCK